jgi:hypothetical protein
MTDQMSEIYLQTTHRRRSKNMLKLRNAPP